MKIIHFILATAFHHLLAETAIRRAIKRSRLSIKNFFRFTSNDFFKSTQFIESKLPFTPDIVIVAGNSLASLADVLENPVYLDYKDVPNFPVPTIEGHIGRLVFGTIGNTNIVIMQGRFHYYEGYSLEEVTLPIRCMAHLGAKKLIVTNTAGAINPTYKLGDIMFIKDHINFFSFCGESPLRGPNDLDCGQRFLSLNKTYDRHLLNKAKDIADKMGLSPYVHEGVYALLGGPTYETVAEVNFLKMVGADAVGMSSIPEVLAGRHCGMIVFGFCLISTICVSSYEDERELSHFEAVKVVGTREKDLKKFLIELVATLSHALY